MQFPEKCHQRVIERLMLHATMNLFNCVLLQVIQKLCKLGNNCKQDVQETAWESSLFLAENLTVRPVPQADPCFEGWFQVQQMVQ